MEEKSAVAARQVENAQPAAPGLEDAYIALMQDQRRLR
jgi:hypothetical protein